MGNKRGEKNHNPFNLKWTPTKAEGGKRDPWNGEVGVDGPFLVFDTDANGLRAGAITARSYFKVDGVETLNEFGERWAPATDNPGAGEDEYGQDLAKQIPIGPDEAFPYDDPDQFDRLLRAILINEEAEDIYSDGLLQYAQGEAFTRYA